MQIAAPHSCLLLAVRELLQQIAGPSCKLHYAHEQLCVNGGIHEDVIELRRRIVKTSESMTMVVSMLALISQQQLGSAPN